MATVCSDCSKKALDVWCPQCTKSFCSDCSEKHEQKKHHEPIPNEHYIKLPPFIRDLCIECPEHGSIYQYLCRIHDQILCKKCRAEKHSKCHECRETPKLFQIVGNVKNSEAFESIILNMNESLGSLQEGIKKCQQNLNDFLRQKEEMKEEVESITRQVISHIQKLKNEKLTEINNVFEENEEQLQETLKQLQTVENTTREILEQKEAVKQYASNYQTFIGIKEMEAFVEECNTILEGFSESGDMDNIDIQLVHNNDLDTLLSQEELFGDIRVTRCHSLLGTSQSLQAQSMAPAPPPIKLRLQQTVELEEDRYCGGCTMASGLLVVTGKQHLKLIDSGGSLKSTILLDDATYDVTVIDDSRVAVSHPMAQTISTVDVIKHKVIDTIPVQSTLYGISHHNGHILFCVPQTGLKRLNIENHKIDTVVIDEKVTRNSYVDFGKKRICYTCPDTNDAVVVLDNHYKVLYIYQDQGLLRFPCGVAVGRHNNVYVIGFETNNLLLISPEKSVYQLLNKDDSLDSPTAVHYNQQSKKLMVITAAKREIKIYSPK